MQNTTIRVKGERMAYSVGKSRLSTLFDTGTASYHAQGEIIYNPQLSDSSSLFMVTSGFVKAVSLQPDGERVYFCIYNVGDIFPLGFLRSKSDINVPTYYEAKTWVTVRKIPLEVLVTAVQQDSHLRSVIFEQALLYQEILKTRILCSSYRHARKRICALVLHLANRFGVPYAETTVVDVPMSHADIADATGLARETVTREMRLLLSREIISYKSKTITVKDMDALAAQLETT